MHNDLANERNCSQLAQNVIKRGIACVTATALIASVMANVALVDIDTAYAANIIERTNLPMEMISDLILDNIDDVKENELYVNNHILQANMSKVEGFVITTLQNLFGVLIYSGYTVETVSINPRNYHVMFNNIDLKSLDDPISKFYNLSIVDMNDRLNLWITSSYFSTKEVERIIKLKFNSVATMYNGKMYLKILPQENFSLIYDFIEDICRLC